MITAKQLNELILFKAPAPSVLSAYFELTPGDDAVTLIRRMERLREQQSDVQSLREDTDRTARFLLEEHEPGGARALAVFSSRRLGLWRACYLPQPLKTRLWTSETPALKPLLSVTDQYRRFGVAVVGARRARFFEVFLGRGREYEEHAISAADYADAAAFAKAAADKLESLSRNHNFQRVVVGVEEQLARALLGYLHTHSQQNLIVDPSLTETSSLEEIVLRIASCEGEARKVREMVLAHRLIDSAKTTRGAVLGLDRTLDALQNGRVRMLLVRDGFAKMGRSCPACGQLSIAWSKCPKCQTPTQAVFNMVAEMAARAVETGCEVVRLLHDTPLDNLGRIGAELLPAAAPMISATGASAAADAPAAV